MNKKVLAFAMVSIVTSGFLYGANEAYSLESVTVSANKIEENIQDVPQSITVIDEETLQEKGIKNVADAMREVPNMYINNAANGSTISFRGLNTSMFTNNNPVVIYVDGVPYYDRYDFDPSLADVAQIEVLRGPQGTLYGKDAVGAVVNIITKKPSNEWHGNVGAEYGNYNTVQSSFNTSGALIADKLYAGINGTFKVDDGWIENEYPGMDSDANQKRDRKMSGFVLLKPTERFSGKVSLSDTYTKHYFMNGFATDSTGNLSGVDRDDGKHISSDVPTVERTAVKAQSLNLAYDFDAFKVESTTTHKKLDLESDFDADFQANNTSDGLKQFNYSEIETWTEELKFSGQTDAFKWVSGLYVDKEKREQGPYGAQAMSGGAVYDANADSTTDSQTQALFGQVMIPFWEKFELTLGGRYQRIKKEIDLVTTQTWGGMAFPDYAFEGEKTWNAFIPKVALSYKINDALTTYASISKGYMPGGFNYFATSGGMEENSFDPQTSINYEVGAKYVGDDYMLNASVFRMNIEDIHIYKISGGGAVWLTDNAKKAHSQGVELEGKYFLSQHIELSGALGLIEAKYDDYDAGTRTYDGERIENTPRYTANMGIAYVATAGWYGRVDFNAIGSTSYYDGANSQMIRSDGAIISNAKLGYKFKAWDVYSFINNITDESYISSYQSKTGLAMVGFNDPRRFGVGFRYSF
ncbi:TonB-dependent receptor [Sulfurospirillum barnesii]|uniref:Outer membrane receptor for ferrienterochelin and colicins n=1 Tax=Sulfurospirillum barnesii (strain ATCC 700032 / DSM 10660 / SES-3) TaxID=760154 RepID=I3XYA0_SULBS|nr:TonB-dependent receptor [Sulfurospirillum barnesii]AFL68924.1 outer membrane receptor for ferrienterochelin and colicins [Sulfurospirillum barnesii SES-3]